MDIPVIRVTVFSLKEHRNLCHRYMVASLSSKTRKKCSMRRTQHPFLREDRVFLVPNPELYFLGAYCLDKEQ